MTEQVRGNASHVAGSEHQRLGAREIVTVRHVTGNDEIAEDLRQDIPESRELGVLAESLRGFHPHRDIRERRGLNTTEE